MSDPEKLTSSLLDEIKNHSNFLTDLSRPEPHTGGGSASAYVGGVASILILKVCRIEAARKLASPEFTEGWNSLARKCEECAQRFMGLVRDDSEAYQEWMVLRKLNNAQNQVKKAFMNVVGVPVRIIRLSAEALEVARQTLEGCRPHLASDIMVAVEMLASVMNGALRIAQANLEEDSGKCGCEELEHELLNAVNVGMGRYRTLVRKYPTGTVMMFSDTL